MSLIYFFLLSIEFIILLTICFFFNSVNSTFPSENESKSNIENIMNLEINSEINRNLNYHEKEESINQSNNEFNMEKSIFNNLNKYKNQTTKLKKKELVNLDLTYLASKNQKFNEEIIFDSNKILKSNVKSDSNKFSISDFKANQEIKSNSDENLTVKEIKNKNKNKNSQIQSFVDLDNYYHEKEINQENNCKSSSSSDSKCSKINQKKYNLSEISEKSKSKFSLQIQQEDNKNGFHNLNKLDFAFFEFLKETFDKIITLNNQGQKITYLDLVHFTKSWIIKRNFSIHQPSNLQFLEVNKEQSLIIPIYKKKR